MKKILFVLASLLLCLTPALAQRGQHGNSQHTQAQHVQVQHEHVAAPVRGERQHNDIRRDDREAAHQGYHFSHGNSRSYWRGDRYDHDYFTGHWGRENRFYWGRCNWWGQPFYPGSYFWFNGGYFEIIDAVPDYWDDGEVYVEWVDGYGYALVNPIYPGVYYRLRVRF